MHFEFIDTLQVLVGRKIAVELEKPVQLGEVLDLLMKSNPAFARCMEEYGGDVLPSTLIFVKKSRLLRFDDIVENEDVIFAYIPAAGG